VPPARARRQSRQSPTRVIGVQSAAARARIAVAGAPTRPRPHGHVCQGLATHTASELPQRILWQWLDDFVLVSDEEIQELASKRVTLIASGGNVDREQILDVLRKTRRDSQAVASVARL
jgi:threonine dehydratase